MPTNHNEAELRQVANNIYNYMAADHSGNWGMDLGYWDWVPGVGVIAMLEYGMSGLHAQALLDLQQWTKLRRQPSLENIVVNAAAPYAIFPEIYRITGNRSYAEQAEHVAKWLCESAPRTHEGALEHTVTEQAAFPQQVWADTVFMALLFMARLSRLQQNESMADEVIRQLQLHFTLLQDKQTGVLFHGWNSHAGNHMSAARWTRGNAWVALGLPMIAQELLHWREWPKSLTNQYRELSQGLLSFQQQDGMWRTVMDQPHFYCETSGSAGIACGWLKAVRLGFIETSYAEAAQLTLGSVLRLIGSDGEVGCVSSGTPVKDCIDDYNSIPFEPTLYGQGLALMLLVESLSHQ